MGRDGMRSYFQTKIDELELAVQTKSQNLLRLEAQRNDLNARGRCPRLSCVGTRVPMTSSWF